MVKTSHLCEIVCTSFSSSCGDSKRAPYERFMESYSRVDLLRFLDRHARTYEPFPRVSDTYRIF